MRFLFILTGIPGSGKSSWIYRCNLEPWTVSSDQERLNIYRPELTPEGNFVIPGHITPHAFNNVRSKLQQRMAQGETVFIDATNLADSEVKPYVEFAKQYIYKVVRLVFDVPLDKCLLNNEQAPHRSLFRQVPEEAILRLHERFTTAQASWEYDEDMAYLYASDAPLAIDSLREPVDFGRYFYESIIRQMKVSLTLKLPSSTPCYFVGDVQGCHQPLNDFLISEDIESKLATRDCYLVFCGDLLDRGIENGKVLSTAIRLQATYPDHVIFIEGNHDTHLFRWARGDLGELPSYWTKDTLPQLEEEGITPEAVIPLLKAFKPLLWVETDAQKILATHPGFSVPIDPSKAFLISTRQLTKGAEGYSVNIDAKWAYSVPQEYTQIHGHRNLSCIEMNEHENSHNLEGRVEYGGVLRVVKFTTGGKTFLEFPCVVYDTAPKNSDWHTRPFWATRGDRRRTKNLSVFDKPDYSVRIDDEHRTVSIVINRNVDWDARWDSIPVNTRGLIYTRDTEFVVARGYPKFHYYQEGMDLSFPMNVFVKYNGFLGLLGYNPETDSLNFSTKSGTYTDLAKLFEQLFTSSTTPMQRRLLKAWLRDTRSCMTFEVIDPKNDPHIEEYSHPQCVLLDCFHATDGGDEITHYKQLVQVADMFNLDVKQRVKTLNSESEFLSFLKQCETSANHQNRQSAAEGYVIEWDVLGAASPQRIKVKLPNYVFWKRIRTLKGKVVKGVIPSSLPDEERGVLEFMMTLPVHELEAMSIPDLRKKFYEALKARRLKGPSK